jgi:Uma2 family endonuclease
VQGKLILREPPGGYHSHIAMRLGYLVGAWVYPRDAGILLGQDAGFKIASDPDTVRGPDLAFVRAERADRARVAGYPELAPDLAVEIISPNDRRGEVLSKVGQWIDAGVSLVWVIDPRRADAQVHRADGSIAVIPTDGALDGEDVLPGFRLVLAELFQGVEPAGR